MGLPVRISIRCQGNSQKLWYNNYISCKFKEIISCILGDKVLSITKYIYIYIITSEFCAYSASPFLCKDVHTYITITTNTITHCITCFIAYKKAALVYTHTHNMHTQTHNYTHAHILYTHTLYLSCTGAGRRVGKISWQADTKNP